LLGGLTLVATAGLLGVRPEPVAAEPPPETTRIRLAHHPAICTAPYFLAKEFLSAEGFTDVQDVKMESGWSIKAMVAREIDIALNFSGPLITRVDAGDPLVILAGIHVGCFQLFGGERVRAIRDLKGKTVALLVFHVWRDKLSSITDSEELTFSMSASLQSTDRHQGSVGQAYWHVQRDA